MQHGLLEAYKVWFKSKIQNDLENTDKLEKSDIDINCQNDSHVHD